jgi:hypothetical protein
MTFSFSTTVPAANNSPADDQSVMLTNNVSISGLISVDHVGFDTSGGGQHAQVTFNNTNIPTPVMGSYAPPTLFTNTVAGLPQLFFYSGDAGHSANQSSPSTIVANGSVLLMGGIILKWGNANVTSPSGVVTFPVAFPNNCFAVQATVNRSGANICVALDTVSTTGFKAYGTVGNNASSIAFTLYYLAIGN